MAGKRRSSKLLVAGISLVLGAVLILVFANGVALGDGPSLWRPSWPGGMMGEWE